VIEIPDKQPMKYWEHFIPELEESVVASYRDGILVGKNYCFTEYTPTKGFKTCKFHIWDNPWGVNRWRPAQSRSKWNLRPCNFGVTIIGSAGVSHRFISHTFIDLKTGISTVVDVGRLSVLVYDFQDFAVGRGTVKCYQKNGTVLLLPDCIDVTGDNHLPFRKPSNVKNGRR